MQSILDIEKNAALLLMQSARHSRDRIAVHGFSSNTRAQVDYYRLLDFESDAADSFASFGRSLDLFGDGSVRIVFTPGHTAGHCSVILRLAERDVLLTADAAYSHRTLAENALPYKMDDEHRFRRSLREIQLYVEQNPDALVVPGHDMDAWRRLDSLYE